MKIRPSQDVGRVPHPHSMHSSLNLFHFLGVPKPGTIKIKLSWLRVDGVKIISLGSNLPSMNSFIPATFIPASVSCLTNSPSIYPPIESFTEITPFEIKVSNQTFTIINYERECRFCSEKSSISSVGVKIT